MPGFSRQVYLSHQGSGSTLDDIDGRVSDNQRSYAPTAEVADFFLNTFLGCKLMEAPDVSTRKFFLATEAFISSEVPDAERKTQYETALMAEMNSQRMVVNPIRFADDHLEVYDREAFRTWIEESDLAQQPFEKDTQLIQNRLRKISYDFHSGVQVMAPPDAIDQELVGVNQMDDGRTHLQVRDRLKDLKGR